MDSWRTSIVDASDGHIRIRGYDLLPLMSERTFTDTIFLLHQGRLPSLAERRLLDAILTGVADHGPGAPSCATARLAVSGNRQSLSAAVAAGLLAVGDDHGGAGLGCMEQIAEGIALAKTQQITLDEAAQRIVADARGAWQAVTRLRASRALDRSAHGPPFRDGGAGRHRGRRHRLRARNGDRPSPPR